MSRFSRISFAAALCAATLVLVAVAAAQPASRPTQSAAAAVLPHDFSGWQQTASSGTRNAAQADASNAALLKEFGFFDEQTATYVRDGRKLQLNVLRFADAGGAYGAYSFYLQADAIKEDVGDEAVSLRHAVLFRKGNLLVKAQFEELTAMSAADLRDLAAELPVASGPQASLPTLPGYLPKDSLVNNSTRYVVGPEAFNRLALPISAALVDFNCGAEAVAARYRISDNFADLLLISYPTPQIASERSKAIEAAMAQAGQQAVATRHSGPIVAVAIDPASPRDARALASAVHYDANVTWNEPTYLGPRNNVGTLVIACLMLAAILVIMALVAGIAFGGFRILMKKLFPDRLFDRSRDVEIIRLKLGE
ncbi:MAG TPA: DUF6599 family protein [Terriglobales bacterium]|nr:DUF6599 family protein [Terriglobales bacterium]